MKFLALLCMILSASVAFAQTAPKSTVPVKSKALLKAEADLKAMIAERDALANSAKVQQEAIEQLTKEKATLNAKASYDAGLLVILSKEIRGMPFNDTDKQALTEIVDRDALTVAADIEKNVSEGVNIIKKLVADNSTLTDRYNSLLADYRDYTIRAEKQVRLSNALAIYSAMPKYTPPQQVNMNVTFSDCTKLPSLCVH